MKVFWILNFGLFICLLLGCLENKTTSAQSNSSKIRIDRNLKHPLFDFLPYGVVGDINSEDDHQYISNAAILEKSNNHKAFDTCHSYFKKDTLIIEFRSLVPFVKDKLKIKVKSKQWSGNLINDVASIDIQGRPKSLIFKDRPKRKGQELFGEISIDFWHDSLARTFSYQGPFRCIIE